MAAGEDPREINRSALAELDSWLAERQLRVVRHRKLPLREGRWLGVCRMPGWFESHCVVMRAGQLLFDPGAACVRSIGLYRPVWQFTPGDVADGYSFRSVLPHE
jgi:hypothetical protein